MNATTPAPSYANWLQNVRSLIAFHRPDIQVAQLDPNETWQAFQRGISPSDFATQPVLPLLPLHRSDNGDSARPGFGDDLVPTIWLLTGATIVAYLLGTFPAVGWLRPLSIFPDIASLVLAVILVVRGGQRERTHGWVRISLEALSFAYLVVSLLAARPVVVSP